MKRLLLLLIFFLNIATHISHGKLNISTGNISYAQCPGSGGMVGYGCCTPNSGGGTGPDWWSTFTTWLSNIINGIGEIFNSNGEPNPYPSNSFPGYGISWYIPDLGQPVNGANGGDASGLYVGITPAGYYVNGSAASVITNLQPYTNAVFTGTWDPITNPNGTFVVTFSGFNFDDCAGVTFGGATTDVCGICSGGSTGIEPCNYITNSSKDTLKPTKVNCDSIDPGRNMRSAKSDEILNFIKDSAATKNALDSAPYRKFEVGLAIDRYANPAGGFIYRTSNYNKTGNSNNVHIVNTILSVATLHIHPFEDSAGQKFLESPSPQDMYSLLQKWANDTALLHHQLDRYYVIYGGPSRNEYALVISDSAKAKQFLANHPYNSLIEGNQADPRANNWKGDPNTEGSLYFEFLKAIKEFKKEGYPESMKETYANVYMMQTKGLGIKLQQKVNGQFKELNFVKVTDPSGKVHYRITICQ